MKTGVVYTIRHKDDAHVCYVGQTRQQPERRWWHYNRSQTPIGKAIRARGGVDAFEFCVIEAVPLSELDERERYWIAKLETLAPRGLNQLSGGRVSSHTEATKAKISRSSKGRVLSDSAVANLSKGKLKYWAKPENRERQTASISEWWANPDNREKQREAAKAHFKNNPTAKDKQRSARLKGIEAWRGSAHSDDTKAKIAAAQRIRWAKRKEAKADVC